jgi:hypothetical protein
MGGAVLTAPAAAANVPAAGAGGPTPRVWAILGDKLGDNAQVRAVMAALPWPVEEKRLQFRRPFRTGKPLVLPSLYHVTTASAAQLVPPWPDLVLTIGRRPSMAALWVRRQSRGRTRIALFGPPKGMARAFSAVVVAAHYHVPASLPVLRLSLPLLAADPRGMQRAAETWRQRLSALPRPLTAVFVGAATRPFRFDARVARQLVADSLAATHGAGTLYVTTSRRTPPAVVEAIAAALPDGALLHRFVAGAADNPYLALLALADRCIVTGDSVSMLVEVARTGAPLAIFPLPRRRFALAGVRDLTDVHDLLTRSGRAVPLGQPFPRRRPPEPLAADAPDVTAVRDRLCGLLATPVGGILRPRAGGG